MDQNTNRGILVAPRLASQWLMGAVTPIVVPKRGMSDWSAFLPDFEGQSDTIMDTMACLTFSGLAAIETQVNCDIAQKRFSQEALDYFTSAGYMVNGKFKCSARYSAKMNGTSSAGNYVGMVANGFANGHDGLLPESDLPFTAGMTFDQFYSNITPQQVAKAKQIYKYISIQYQELTDAVQMREAVLNAPVQVCTPICPGWDSGATVGTCSGNPSHATVVYELDTFGNYDDFDSYPPFKQKLAANYDLMVMYQFVAQPAPVQPDHTVQCTLKVGMSGSDVTSLQVALKNLGFFPKDQASTGYFGGVTLGAVEAFQKSAGLAVDGIVGSITFSELIKKNV